MPRVTILLPVMLGDSLGTTRISVDARTLPEALEKAYQEKPALRFHLCEESGEFRVHVLCFVHGENTRDMKSMEVALKEGDEISIVQAISGG